MGTITLCAIFLVILAVTLADRTSYHSQGHEGPYSYKFGFDTGPGQGYHRQFRHEEKDGYGIVHGKYGYYDKYGKPIVVYYRAHPYDGFEILKGQNY